MPNNKHIIKKLSINLNLNQQSEAANIQQNISDLSKRRLFALLEKIFDEFDTDEIIRIDTLKIDLGQLNKAELETDFIEKIEKKLRSQLKEQLYFAKTKKQLDKKKVIDLKQLSSAQSIHELLDFFLQTGNFPWWANQNNFRDFEEKILQYAKGNSIAFNLLIRSNISNSSTRKRLSSQFSEGFLTKISPTYFPQSKKILQLKKDFSHFLHNIINKRNNKQKFNTFWWDSLFEISLTHNLNTISYEKLLVILLRKITNTQNSNFIPLDELLEAVENQVGNLKKKSRRKISKDFIKSIKKVNQTVFKQRKKFNKNINKNIITPNSENISKNKKFQQKENTIEDNGKGKENSHLENKKASENNNVKLEKKTIQDSGKGKENDSLNSENKHFKQVKLSLIHI